jgi:hypothetical protein
MADSGWKRLSRIRSRCRTGATHSRNITLTAPFFSETAHIEQAVDIGLVRLNYRFGGFGAPVAARY